MEYETVPPEPAVLVESPHAFAYDLATALTDLADNSLFYHSRRLAVHFLWQVWDSMSLLQSWPPER
jgi:hypothetical protein